MDENKTSVDILWEEITSIQKILGEAKEGSSLNDYNKTIRKVLLLSCASFFEVEMTKMLKRYVRKVSNNDEKLVNFLEKQAINQKYHTLFNWGEPNNPDGHYGEKKQGINQFTGLFGKKFKDLVENEIENNEEFKNGKACFIEIGHIRNILAHNDFASYLYENKTPEDIFDLYTKAKCFIPKIEELLNMKENANPTTNN